jgi:hypothetical protein
LFADTPQELREISQERTHHHQRKALVRQVLSSPPYPVADSMATIVELAQTRTSLARVQACRPDLLGSCLLLANAKVRVCLPSPSLTTVADMHKRDHDHQHWTICDMVQILPSLRRRKSTKVCGPESDETKSTMRTPTQTTSTLHHPLMLPSRFLPTGDLVLLPLTPV